VKTLLVLELWGLGDLMMATPFLKAATSRFEVFLLAKPDAIPVAARLFPEVKVIPFVFPWTAFKGKYRLHHWPWAGLREVLRLLRLGRFDIAVSARFDPRDHVLMGLTGARRRLGFPRLGSGCFLTDRLSKPPEMAHRHEYWRAVAAALEFELPDRRNLEFPSSGGQLVVLHTGAAQPARVWPLDRYARIAARLRERGCAVQIMCDSGQKEWWQAHGEESVIVPKSIDELFGVAASARVFIGNDSGPGHLAAISGVPTFTIFGNQYPERFAPLHPKSEWIEGRPCRYKPCYDSCHFEVPHCLMDVGEDEVWRRVGEFLAKHAVPGY
jgi:heptosyltransferase-2